MKHPTRRYQPPSPIQAFLNKSGRERMRLIKIEQEKAIIGRDDWMGLLATRDGYCCCCCGTRRNLTIDHITPLSLGGRTEMGNMQILCSFCNRTKNNKIIDYRIKHR